MKTVDPISGMVTEFKAEGDRVSLRYSTKGLSALRDDCRRDRESWTRSDINRPIHRYASIPPTLQIRWMGECGHPPGSKGFIAYALAQLRKPEYAHLRRIPLTK